MGFVGFCYDSWCCAIRPIRVLEASCFWLRAMSCWLSVCCVFLCLMKFVVLILLLFSLHRHVLFYCSGLLVFWFVDALTLCWLVSAGLC